MISGIDHDTQKKDYSVAAFVASLNPTYTEHFPQIKVKSKTETLNFIHVFFPFFCIFTLILEIKKGRFYILKIELEIIAFQNKVAYVLR